MRSCAMRVRLMAPAVLLALGMGACDPVHTLNVRQSLRPAPDADCLARALAASPRVASAQPSETRPRDGFDVTLHDNVAGRITAASITRKVAADSSAVITLSYSWMGNFALKPDERPRMRAAAEGLVEEVRATCAPSSPAAPECTTGGSLLPARPCAA
jgi:hypothetical protein